MKKLVLVGGGHAHLAVLQRFAKQSLTDVEVILVTRTPFQLYSGMLPGWMAGHYSLEHIQIDLRPWAKAANMSLILDTVRGIDAQHQVIKLAGGEQISYDYLSLDIGSETDISCLEALEDKLLPVKPLNNFVSKWPQILTQMKQKTEYRLVVIGGGAASVELASAAQFSIKKHGLQAQTILVTSESGILASHSDRVQRQVLARLKRMGVQVVSHRVTGATNKGLVTHGTSIAADQVIVATGAHATGWLANSGLQCSETGFVVVDGFQRSVSHPNVFAAGDVCARQDVAMARSGVHAVHVGPILADNLFAVLSSNVFQSYSPRRSSLYLISCGAKYAVASWGQFSVQGYWVWLWKNAIDQQFIKRFSFNK